MSSPEPSVPVCIGPCRFVPLGFTDAVEQIQSKSRDKTFGYVVTPNIDHVARLLKYPDDADIQGAYSNAALTLCDSRILDKVARLAGQQFKAVIPGSSLTEYLFKSVLTPSDRIAIIGGSDSVISQLTKTYEHLAIRHTNPSMGFIHKPEEVSTLLDWAAQQQANYTFLALGSPQQERLAHAMQKSGVFTGVGLCIGASLEFLVGEKARAPAIMQTLHLEWLHRLMQEPTRLARRYGANALALPSIYRAIRLGVRTVSNNA